MRRARLWLVLACAVPAVWPQAAAAAPRSDPAPIAEAAVANVLGNLRRGTAHRVPDILRRQLDGAVEVVKQADIDAQAGREARFSERRRLLESKERELSITRDEVRILRSQVRASLVALGVREKVKAWDRMTDEIEERFAQALLALERVRTSGRGAARRAAIEAAQRALRDMHGRTKEPIVEPGVPTPTFRVLRPPPGQAAPPTAAQPPAYAIAMAPSHGDDVVLAAAPEPLPPDAQACSYTAADLAENPEVQLTPEIRALAESLSYSPLRAYRYVAEEIEFEPYWGSLKGAVGTLVTNAGGATDQASLLIALLRASNVPARYVKGIVDVMDDRAHRWVGTQSFQMAQHPFFTAQNPYVETRADSAGRAIGLRVTHVWVEACVPYRVYRGAAVERTGYRWIPLDPSFKVKTYRPGITGNATFDFSPETGYLRTRTDDLPHEVYIRQIEASVKTLPPNFANNTLQDVGYVGAIVPQPVDVLPASLPYQVWAFWGWTPGGSAETAEVPDSHRYKLRVSVMDGTAELLTTTLSYPQVALQRLTLAYLPHSAADQTIWSGWGGDLRSLPASVVNVRPVILTDGISQAVGATPTTLGQTNTVRLRITLGDLQGPLLRCPGDGGGLDPDASCVNKAIYPAITAGAWHAISAYAYQTSDRLLEERAARLLASVRSTPVPRPQVPEELDHTLGEFLHLALLKYYRNLSDASRAIGRVDGAYTEPGLHIGMTSSDVKVQYLFDVPFAVFPGGLLIDVRGGVFGSYDLVSGAFRWPTFRLIGHMASAYEHYLWQETARLEAVSTVRGIQFAKDTGIPVVTLHAGNIACYDTAGSCGPPLMDPSMAPYKAQITANVNGGATVTVPNRVLSYSVPNQTARWNGAVWMAEHPNGSVGAQISGTLGGGYAFLEPAPMAYDLPLEVPSSMAETDIPVNSLTAANGMNSTTVTAADPVNMLTGNLYHVERDLVIKGRGLPFVFERSYNSRNPFDGPLGFGWTHSFNHFLQFTERTGGIFKVSWVDGAGGEKFFRANVSGSTIPPGTVFINPAGVFVDFRRTASGTYTIREKNGLTYTFESDDGSVLGTTPRLLSITDRNGNSLTLSYDGSNLAAATDGLGRSLTFGYAGGTRIQTIQDWTNRTWRYEYDGSGNLVAYRSPLASAGAQEPVRYAYYDDPLNPQLRHALRRYTLPRGNGMTFEYYLNGRVFRHYNDLGETTTFSYNEFRRESMVTTERGFTRRFFFDVHGNLVRLVGDNGGERVYTYDPANPMNRLTKQDPMGAVTRYAYDGNGNVTQVTLPSGATLESSTFDAFGQPGRIKDGRGNYRLLTYESRGNLLQMVALKAGLGAALDPATYVPAPGDVVAWHMLTYDAFGNVLTIKRVRDPATQAGPTVEYDYGDTVNGVTGLNAVRSTRRADRNGDGLIDAAETDTAGLTYDALGRVTRGLRADWSSFDAVYDAGDRVVRGSDRLGNLRDFELDANGNLTRESLTLGTLLDQTSCTYDAADRRLSVTNAGGFTTRFQYDPSGNVIAVANPDGYAAGIDYDAGNHAVQIFDQEGHAVVRSVDLEGKPREIIDANGNRAFFDYYGPDRNGRLRSKIDGAGRVTLYDYDAAGNVTTVTDALGHTTATTYDELGRSVRVVGPAYQDAVHGLVRPVVRSTYDLLGNLLRVDAGRTDAAGATPANDVVTPQMTYVSDDLGRRLRATDPLGRSWQWTYDVQGNPITAVDARGQVARAVYGEGRQLLARVDAMTDGAGALSTLSRFTRTTTQPASPSAGFVFLYRGGICVANAQGTCVGGELTTDPAIGPAVGYLKTSPDAGTVPLYRGTCYADPAGVCTRWGASLTPNGAPIGYLASAAPDSASAEAPLIESGGLLVQGLTGAASGFAWSAQLVPVTEHFLSTGGGTAGYTTDGTLGFVYPTAGADRIALQAYVDTVTGRYYYATAGSPPIGFNPAGIVGYLEASTAGGGIPLYRHVNPSAGAYAISTSATPPSGHQVDAVLGYILTGEPTRYVRNALGQVLTATSPAVTYTYTYDVAHRLASVTDSRGGGKRIDYTYSPGGLLTTMLENEGRRTDYLYDSVGRLAMIWAPILYDAVVFAYDPGGRLVEKLFPNWVATRYRYNPDNTLAQVENRIGVTITQHDYTYDGVGNRQNYTERIGSVTTPYRYVYDPLDRLTEVRNAGTNALLEGYAYDPLGNRTSKTVASATTAYVYDGANQLTEARQTSAAGPLTAGYVYDENGNLRKRCEGSAVTRTADDCTGATVTELAYDGANRLHQVTKTGLPPQRYVYDDQGRRIEKTVDTAAKQFLYSGPDIVAEYTDHWGWIFAAAHYVHGPEMDDPILRRTYLTGVREYYHRDGLGSVIAVTDGTATMTATARYDAWGNAVAQTGAIPLYGYTGREPDETGLIYYRARYYDPGVGRFTQRDPLGVDIGSQYAYVRNSPPNYTDPTGEIPIAPWLVTAFYGSISGAIGGAVTSYASTRDPAKAAMGALVGGAAGAVVGAFQPWLAKSAGSAAAARFVGGMAQNFVGQLGGNVAAGRPLGENFSAVTMITSGVGTAAAGSRAVMNVVSRSVTTAAVPAAAALLEGAGSGLFEFAGGVVDPSRKTDPTFPVSIPDGLAFRDPNRAAINPQGESFTNPDRASTGEVETSIASSNSANYTQGGSASSRPK